MRAGDLSGQQTALHWIWKAKLSCLLLFLSVVNVLGFNAKSHPSYSENSGLSDQMSWGITTFQILNTCSLGSPFMAHPCQHFLYFLF